MPYINFSKSKIIKDGIKSSDKLKLDFNTIYKNTLTPSSPDAQGRSNGKTGSDVERILSFNEIGIQDPGLYTQTWENLVEYAMQCDKKIDLKNQ